jgi:NAD(P)-dependent dehydrogenase (short-subunit alcohol dehydrogenase family)
MVADTGKRSAIVTGGSRGIGESVVRRLAGDGYRVAFCADDQRGVASLERELQAAGMSATGWTIDVKDVAAVQRFVNEAGEAHGGLDAVVGCAGIQRYGSVEGTTLETWREVIDTNLTSMFALSAAAVPLLRRRGGGSIVAVASVQAMATQREVAAYTASKGGLVALIRAIAVDYAAENIRANSVLPGSVDTPMLRWAADKFAGDGGDADALIGRWGSSHPMGRVAKADEVAAAVAFLSGPDASFITGAEVKVDGGLLASLPVALPQ